MNTDVQFCIVQKIVTIEYFWITLRSTRIYLCLIDLNFQLTLLLSLWL
jgi:hypothetical protein